MTQSAATAGSVASHPVITSSTAAPSLFKQTQFACVRVESSNASATVMPTATVTASSGQLHLQDCGGNGGVVVDTVKAGTAVSVTNTLIDSSGSSAAAYFGIRLQHLGVLSASTDVTITGMNATSAGGAGIEATDNSSLTITPSSGLGLQGVLVNANSVNGVHIGGMAHANIGGLTSTANSNGLMCDASSAGSSAANLVLHGSTLLQNRNDGALISAGPGGPCLADLGNVNAGLNVYNVTSRKNAWVGLCYMPTTVAATASTSTWDCGLASGAACVAAGGGTVPVAAPDCQHVGDYNTNSQLTVATPQTCCGM